MGAFLPPPENYSKVQTTAKTDKGIPSLSCFRKGVFFWKSVPRYCNTSVLPKQTPLPPAASIHNEALPEIPSRSSNCQILAGWLEMWRTLLAPLSVSGISRIASCPSSPDPPSPFFSVLLFNFDF